MWLSCFQGMVVRGLGDPFVIFYGHSGGPPPLLKTPCSPRTKGIGAALCAVRSRGRGESSTLRGAQPRTERGAKGKGGRGPPQMDPGEGTER